MSLLQWSIVIYTVPLYISIMYFTILKIQDINKVNKSFSKEKHSYLKCIRLSFVPLLNIIIALKLSWKQI